jgi:hypothetical protein
MGRFNWMLRALWTLSVLMYAVGSASNAAALPTSATTPWTFEQIPLTWHCSVFKELSPGDGDNNANVRMSKYNQGVDGPSYTTYFHAGGSGYFEDEIYYSQPISKYELALCLDTEETNITNFEQNGADETYATDNYMGFKFTLAVAAGNLSAGPHEYRIGSGEMPFSNTPATADAGPDDGVASAANVTLDGSGSNANDAGQSLTYAWTQTSGTTITLSSNTASQPSFTAPTLNIGDPDATLVFSLVVNDGTIDSDADTLTITVTAPSATTAVAPTSLVATSGDGQVSIAFTAPASDGGAAITDYEYQIGSGTWTSAVTTSSPVVITGLTNGTDYSIKLRAVNSAGDGAASAAVSFDTPSPASAFAQDESEIRAVIVNDVTRSLQSTMSANDRMIRDARGRFIDSQRQSSEGEGALSSNNNVAFDIDGSANVNGTTLRTKGTFFGQQGNFEGTQRRLVFGDFDVQHDGDTGSSTATITGRIAWEQMTSNDTMLGYFIGGELAQSNIAGSFEGDQNRLGVTAGGYVVHQLNEQVFLDGFITLGAGRNNLEMANDVLALESDYTTQTATVGAELSGVYEYGQYEFHPELAFSYGKTWMGDVGFTGRAYGLVNNTLSLDAGNVSIANLTLRPEIVWALDAETVADSNSQLSFAPRLICERTIATATIQDCGAGAEIGLMSQSEDGLSSANIRFVVDRVGNSNRSSVVLNLEQRF